MNSGNHRYSDLTGTFSDWGKSVKLMTHPRSWAFFIYPIALSLFLGMGIFGAMLWWLIDIVKSVFIIEWPSALADAPIVEQAKWIWANMSDAAFSIALFVAVLLLTLNVFKWIQLLLLTPYMAYLSSRVVSDLSGNNAQFSWRRWWKETMGSCAIAGLNLSIQLLITLGIATLNVAAAWWTPWLLLLLSPVSAVLHWALSTYFTGASLLDLPIESQPYTWNERWKLVHRSKLSAFLHGGLFALVIGIPFVGLWLAAVIGSGAVAHTAHRKQWLNAQTK